VRVVVTGGTGLIGSRLAASLLDDGHDVSVLTRSPGRDHGLPAGAREVGWDAQTLGDWVTVLPRADAVVHLAGASIAGGRWTEARKRLIRASRVDSCRLLAEALAQCSPRPAVLVQASAVGYYGPHGDVVVSEETPPGSDFLARTCIEWEASSAALETLGVRRVLLRTGLVLADEGGALPLMKLPFLLFVGGPVGDGTQCVPWIHLDDEVRAVRFLLAHDEASGPFNLTAPNPVTNAELSAHLAAVLHRPNLFRAPSFAVQAILGEMAALVLTGQRAVPQRLQELGFTFRFPEVRGALEDLLRG
jgi:hypothetical protein